MIYLLLLILVLNKLWSVEYEEPSTYALLTEVKTQGVVDNYIAFIQQVQYLVVA